MRFTAFNSNIIYSIYIFLGGEPKLESRLCKGMKIVNGLEILEVQIKNPGGVMTLCPSLIWDDKDVILVDTGIPGQIENIKQQFEKTDVPFERLSKIILTHQDLDHMGSVAAIQKELGEKVKVFAHEEEKPYIQFDKKPIKLSPERLAQLQAQYGNKDADAEKNPKEVFSKIRARVDTIVHDAEELPYCGGIVIVHTPGHTPGHICLYLKKYKALIAGDAINVVEGELTGPNPLYTYDMKLAVNSLEKLTKYDIQKVICHHGGLFSNNPNLRIAQLAEAK